MILVLQFRGRGRVAPVSGGFNSAQGAPGSWLLGTGGTLAWVGKPTGIMAICQSMTIEPKPRCADNSEPNRIGGRHARQEVFGIVRRRIIGN